MINKFSNVNFTSYYGNNGKSYMPEIDDKKSPEFNARKVQRGFDKAGFNWVNNKALINNFNNEVDEFKEAVAKNNKAEIVDELGDVFYNLVEINSKVGKNSKESIEKSVNFNLKELNHISKINPRQALLNTVKKNVGRFKFVEETAVDEKDFKDNFRNYWEAAKALQKKLAKNDVNEN